MEKQFAGMILFVLAVAHTSLCLEERSDLPALVDGLSWTFYNESCPKLESIVKATLQSLLKDDTTKAPALLRLLFHDCFVQGCDGSILLNGTGSELEDTPNLTIRKEALEIIQLIKDAVEADCPEVVSCADILALAGTYAVYMAGGPEFAVPLGRRDSLTFANESVTVDNLPAPTSNVSVLMSLFSEKGFTDFADLVALSGGHTFGISHCSSFIDRLYPTQDSTLNESFAEELYLTCPSSTAVNTTDLDIRTPNAFDNKYYVDLQNNEGLLTSDQNLYTDSRTKHLVKLFAKNQSSFYKRFLSTMVKMVQLDVLTGREGEIRKVCSAVNPTSTTTYIVHEQRRSSSI
ncbi:hypothetical protein SUGI_1029630 [Cryptomeria japonica]|uniref:peroxidase 12-like n=1 Tax=Cryptomeria japonica TaxID=3369 RepID=UPI00241474B0|nr:peroxidase 12-like [Cryptomeria japonica]GLJ48823.1 hypothetical protein SUGI_1029630 [Cryptomeria japonica]